MVDYFHILYISITCFDYSLLLLGLIQFEPLNPYDQFSIEGISLWLTHLSLSITLKNFTGILIVNEFQCILV